MMQPPTPEAVRNARLGAGLTQSEAAGLVYATPRAWANWESGNRTMDQALFHLFIQRLTEPSHAALQALGLAEGDPVEAYSQLVVVILRDGSRQQPVDTIARENFLAYEIESDGIHAVISSLKTDRISFKPSIHRTRLLREHNQHVEKAATRWEKEREAKA